MHYPDKTDDNKRKLWATVLATLGLGSMSAPFVLAANTGGIFAGITVGTMLLFASIAVYTDSDMNGPPPSRIG